MEETQQPVPEGRETEPKKRRLWLRILCIVLAAVLILIALLAITFTSVWNDEISTV